MGEMSIEKGARVPQRQRPLGIGSGLREYVRTSARPARARAAARKAGAGDGFGGTGQRRSMTMRTRRRGRDDGGYDCAAVRRAVRGSASKDADMVRPRHLSGGASAPPSHVRCRRSDCCCSANQPTTRQGSLEWLGALTSEDRISSSHRPGSWRYSPAVLELEGEVALLDGLHAGERRRQRARWQWNARSAEAGDIERLSGSLRDSVKGDARAPRPRLVKSCEDPVGNAARAGRWAGLGSKGARAGASLWRSRERHRGSGASAAARGASVLERRAREPVRPTGAADKLIETWTSAAVGEGSCPTAPKRRARLPFSTPRSRRPGRARLTQGDLAANKAARCGTILFSARRPGSGSGIWAGAEGTLAGDARTSGAKVLILDAATTTWLRSRERWKMRANSTARCAVSTNGRCSRSRNAHDRIECRPALDPGGWANTYACATRRAPW